MKSQLEGSAKNDVFEINILALLLKTFQNYFWRRSWECFEWLYVFKMKFNEDIWLTLKIS